PFPECVHTGPPRLPVTSCRYLRAAPRSFLPDRRCALSRPAAPLAGEHRAGGAPTPDALVARLGLTRLLLARRTLWMNVAVVAHWLFRGAYGPKLADTERFVRVCPRCVKTLAAQIVFQNGHPAVWVALSLQPVRSLVKLPDDLFNLCKVLAGVQDGPL